MDNPVPMKWGRPLAVPPRTMLEFVLEAAALACLLGMVQLLLGHWATLPARIPSHFDASGAVDAWGAKSTLLLLPSVGLGVYVLLTLVSFFPQYANYPVKVTVENSARLYHISRIMVVCLKVELLLTFLLLTHWTIQVALHRATGLPYWFLPAFLLMLFGTITPGVIAMFKVR